MQRWEYKRITRSRGWQALEPGHEYHLADSWGPLSEDDEKLPPHITWPLMLKQLGEMGWELVAVVPLSGITGGEGGSDIRDYAGFSTTVTWVFKRPIE